MGKIGEGASEVQSSSSKINKVDEKYSIGNIISNCSSFVWLQIVSTPVMVNIV